MQILNIDNNNIRFISNKIFSIMIILTYRHINDLKYNLKATKINHKFIYVKELHSSQSVAF